MINYSQLQNLKLSDIANNPEIANAIAGLVHGGGLSGYNIQLMAKDGIYPMENITNAIQRLDNMFSMGELSRNIDRYANWNHPDTAAAANSERAKALDELKKIQATLKQYGVDITSVPGFQNVTKTLGLDTNLNVIGTGVTAEQAAQMPQFGGITPPVVTETPANITSTAINFKPGLNDAQKQSITLLSQKPREQWTDTDINNWNYATNNSPIPGNNTGGTINWKQGLSDVQKSSVSSLLNKPQDQWSETDWANWNYATNKSAVPSAGAGAGAGAGTTSTNLFTKTGNASVDATLEALANGASNGGIILPDVELDDNQLKSFLDQASLQFDPYYQEQYKIAKTDLEKSLGYIAKENESAQQNLETEFNKNIDIQRQGEADSGTIFSGGRAKREIGTADAYTRKSSDLISSATKAVEQAQRATEQMIGSNQTSSVFTPQLQTRNFTALNAGSGGIVNKGTVTPSSLIGGITGKLPNEQKFYTQTEAQRLEDNARTRRANQFYTNV